MKRFLLFGISMFACLSSLFAQYDTSEDKQMKQVYDYYYTLFSNNQFDFQSSAEWNSVTNDLLVLERYFKKCAAIYSEQSHSYSDIVLCNKYARLSAEYSEKANNCTRWKSISQGKAMKYRNKGL